VIRVLRGLGPGQVVTYGEVAEEAGSPGAARAVGNILARTAGLPWWRVVPASGRLVAGHERTQARLLRSEGVEVDGARLRLPRPPRAPAPGTAGRPPRRPTNGGGEAR
jgi:methylated-DNA-protein-cysteine methyltransferase related protein